MGPESDVEPTTAARRAAVDFSRRILERVRDTVVGWISAAIVALLSVVVLAIGVAILSSLPVVAIAAFVGVAIAAIVFAVFARRLYHLERSRRRWAAIALLRERQRRLKAEEGLDVVALVLAGDHESSSELHRIERPDVLQAFRALRGRRAQDRNDRIPISARAAHRRDASPAPPDVEQLKRQRAAHMAERKALETEIQALAVPADSETREAAQIARRAAQEADRVALERHRRGQRPTMPASTEQRLEIGLRPDGTHDVRRLASEPTPEEIAQRGATPEAKPSASDRQALG